MLIQVSLSLAREKINLGSRNIEFDLLRSIIITSAIVLHFYNSYSLYIIVYSFQVINSQLFNVGNFFFFTAGYMGHSVYYKQHKNVIKQLPSHKFNYISIYLYVFMRSSHYPLSLLSVKPTTLQKRNTLILHKFSTPNP